MKNEQHEKRRTGSTFANFLSKPNSAKTVNYIMLTLKKVMQ